MKKEQKAFECIRLVERQAKPRTSGLTYARDLGMGLKSLEAVLESSAEFIDILKLASFVPRVQSRKLLRDKVELCRKHGVDVGLGGALLEIALLQGPQTVKAFLDEVRDLGISHLEVCRQAVIMPLSHLLDLIGLVKDMGIHPLAEVGVAYGITPDEEVYVDEAKLIGTMKKCMEAGAWKVLLESEGLTESRHKKDYRWDVVSKVANAFDLDDVIFEADDRDVYTRYITQYGPEVNLFVDHSRITHLECSRRGGWGKHPVINRVATFYAKRKTGGRR
ncbi:MAG: phosphosulfolactate synthase [Burkholderiales bacterium]|nr:phosphosulfolactate synthase [Burkholderiales bacterium]